MAQDKPRNRRVPDGPRLYIALAIASLLIPGVAAAVDADASATVRGYTTREERRDTGVKHHLTDWLTAAGLFEYEYTAYRQGLAETAVTAVSDASATAVQLSFVLAPRSWFNTELIYEFDAASEQHRMDEAIITFETGNLEVELGEFYVPFGEYFSHFVTSPLLAFGETRAAGMNVSYAVDDQSSLTGFVYQGRAQSLDATGDGLGWGCSVAAALNAGFTLGGSYLSDLADAEAAPFSDGETRWQKSVAGLSAYATASHGRLGVTAEWVHAQQSFYATTPDRDRPQAWNIELAYAVKRNLEGALRLETSRELENAPYVQVGSAITWRMTKHASITAEYLLGRNKPGFTEDDAGRELGRVHQAGAQLSIAF